MNRREEPPHKRQRIEGSREDAALFTASISNTFTVDPEDEQPSQSDENVQHTDIHKQLGRLSHMSIDEDQETRTSLEVECAKRPILDGNYFQPQVEGSDVGKVIIAVCQFCVPKKTLRITLRTTSNLTTHLEKQHPDQYERYQRYVASKRTPSVVDRNKWSCTFSQEIWEANITAFVLDTMIPLRTVENQSFRKIFDDLNVTKNGTTLKHLTRHTLLLRIDRVVEDQLAEIKNIIETTEYVCTTADAWSGKKRRFLGVTLHWIDECTLERRSAAIACKRFPGTHTYDAIARYLIEINGCFNIDCDKLVATITDNGSNFVKAFKEFGIDGTDERWQEMLSNSVRDVSTSTNIPAAELLTEDPAEIDDTFSITCEKQLPHHLRCASHTLNLIATTDTLRAISSSLELAETHQNVMAKCNRVWRSLRSPKTSEALKDYLGIALKRPVVTRWNSLIDCIEQLVSCKSKMLTLSTRDADLVSLKDIFVPQDFRFLEEYLRSTRDLAKAIDLLQGENYCHYGYLLPTLVHFRRQLLLLKESLTIRMCQPIVDVTIRSLESRFKCMFNVTEEGKVAAIAAITHPKFKVRWLRCLSEAKQQIAYNLVVDAVASVSSETVPSDPQPVALEDEWDFGDAPMIFENVQSCVTHATSEGEVTRYLDDPDADFKMLRKYPAIRKVFRRFNTPLPSSASVERLFSYATMLDLPKYNRLNDDHFEQRILAKVNASKKYK